MSSKMVVRILSISLALILLGAFVPNLTNGAVSAVSPTSVPFGEVAVGSQESELLNVNNPNQEQVVVFFLMNGGDCGFSLAYEDNILSPAADGYIYLPDGGIIEGDGSITVEVIFAPTDPPAPCSASLWVIYTDIDNNGIGAAQASLSGTGKAAEEPMNIIIDGQDMGILDFEWNEGRTASQWLGDCTSARNHGEYVRCVALLTKNMKKAKLLNEEEKGAIMKAAAQANIPPRKSSIEDLSHDGTPITDLIKECKEEAKNNKQYMRCVSDLMKEMKKKGEIETRKDKHLIRRYAARLRFHSKPHK